MTTGETPRSRPSYVYTEGLVTLSEVLEDAGLDPKKYSQRDVLGRICRPAMYELLSDGELQLHDPEAVGSSVEKTASDRYGEFYDKMAELKRRVTCEAGPVTDRFNRFARFLGDMLAEEVCSPYPSVTLPESRLSLPNYNEIAQRIDIRFGGYTWSAPTTASFILEYGPGVSGRLFADVQLQALARGAIPAQYVSLSDGPFVNQFLMSYTRLKGDRTFGPNGGRLILERGVFGGREDGMKQGSESLIEQTAAVSKGQGIFDIVLATGLQLADAHELQQGINNAHTLAKPGGKLMVLSPLEKVTDTSVTFPEQVGWAEAAGFRVVWRGEKETGSSLLGRRTLSGLAVLEK
jgi:hypothetical protein